MGFPKPIPDRSLAVADDNDRAKPETTATLDHFSDTVDVDDLIDELKFVFILLKQEPASFTWMGQPERPEQSTRRLELQPGFPGALRNRLHAAVV
jgi:hypothetical protein